MSKVGGSKPRGEIEASMLDVEGQDRLPEFWEAGVYAPTSDLGADA